MLQSVNNILLYKTILSLSCLIILLSFSFNQSLIPSQRAYYKFYHWDELTKGTFIYPKVGPVLSTDEPSFHLLSFYSFKSDSNKIFNADIFPEFNLSNEGNSKIRIFGSVQVNLLKDLSIQNEYELDSKGSDDSNFRGTKRITAGSWVGYLQQSSLTWSYNSGYLSLGRGNPFYLSVNESVFLNAAIPPMEYGYWYHKRKDFQFNWGLMLSKSGEEKKFITFHRYGIHKPHWNIGFTEAVIGVYNSWSSDEIGYILPAAVLLETEENRGINANLVWVIDGKIKRNDWIGYFELLVDDFALDGGSPPQLGGLLGISRKVGKVLTNIEYTRINRWTGNHCNSATIWVDNEVPIGHSIGSDAHQINWQSIYFFKKDFSIEISLNYVEHGNGDPISRLNEWPEEIKCDENFGYSSEPTFPSNSINSADGKLIFYYLIRNWILTETKVLVDKKMPPTYMAIFQFRLN